jgi:UDP-N-acetylmuramate--alanine ligase
MSGIAAGITGTALVAVPDPSAWSRLHLVGIGGAGMAGIARLLLARGIAVAGSDLKESRNLEALRQAGATVFVGHRAAHVGSPDAVVVSSAIPGDNPELRFARETGLPVLSRAQVLAALMRGRRSVAVAGTHGKTTTTSMISVILSRTGRDPTFVIGGDLNESGSGAVHGTGDVFVAEADESDGSFLLLEPDVGIITNVEEDHLDYYADRGAVEAAFSAFAARADRLVVCWDDPGVRRALGHRTDGLVRYGTGAGEPLDVELSVIALDGAGGQGTVRVGVRTVPLQLSVPGRHNMLNATAAVAAADLVGVSPEESVEALRSFSGARRRFELRGRAGGVTFVDDYAHHPTEVAATLGAAVLQGAGRLVAVFQPHRYTRTRAMWRALGESLAPADVVVLTDVYAAGEAPIPGVTGKLVADALAEAVPGKRIVYLPRRADVAPFLAAETRDGDLVLTLGAGDITMTGDEALERIRGDGR